MLKFSYQHTAVLFIGPLLALGLSGCTSTPAPIVTPQATTTTQAANGSGWQSAPTPTPTPTSSLSTSGEASQSPTPNPSNSTQIQPNPKPQAAQPQAAQPSTGLQGLRVAIDPGHNGGNFNNTKTIARKVPDGRGGTKACNTTGTATTNGYRESTFNLAVAKALQSQLETRGASVSLTRRDDNGVGPCVDQRGAAGDNADVLISIHANGSEDKSIKGWFLLYSSDPLNANQGEPSRLLAGHLAETLKTQGFPTNPVGPYTPRADIATINHSKAPVVMLELLEMKNPDDAALAQSPEAHQRYATAIADGIQHWVKDSRRTQ